MPRWERSLRPLCCPCVSPTWRLRRLVNAPSTVMKENEFPLVIGYLTALTALFWLAYLIVTHVGHIHVA